jgi:hypothetical protein
MADYIAGPWVCGSEFSAESWSALHDLNARFLEIIDPRQTWSGRRGLAPGVAQGLTRLSARQRLDASRCPYALFDLRFHDDAHWRARLAQGASIQVADGERDDAQEFAQLCVFYAWHLASIDGHAARLLLGMGAPTVQSFQRLKLDNLSVLAASEAQHLTARWSGCTVYWNALIHAATCGDAPALRRVQLYGLQLAAAARLNG